MKARSVLPTLASILALVACNEKKAQPETPAPEPTSRAEASATPASAAAPSAAAPSAAAPSASAEPAAAAGQPAKGLRAPNNDPEVVKQITAVRDGCKWGRNEFVDACKPMQDWVEWASFPGRQDILSTLVASLEDDSPAVRNIAAVGLEVIGTRPLSDAALATALFDALDEERNPKNCRGIALQAAAVRLAETELDERALKVARTHALSPCRVTLVGAFLAYNPQHYDFTIELAKSDKDPKVRAEAVAAMRGGAQKDATRQQNNCKVWRTLLDDAEPEVAARAIELLGRTGGTAFDAPCVDEWNDLLTHVEAAASAGKAESTKLPWGVCGLFEQKKLTAEQRARALSLLQTLVETSANAEASRMSALDCIGRHDPDAKTFAQKFEQDAAAKVAKAAKAILAAKPR
ncbi:MAG: hypothetical protein KF718_02810 [Polyangiaceae bacterium]|nr:hypothetical protein [Polyangiaceae bacterium]